jgi:NitT/TauT family transport system permease protein
MKLIKRIIITALPGLLFLALWQGAIYGNGKLEFLFASPSAIASVAKMELLKTEIWKDCFITLTEALIGLVCGTFLGTAVGLLLWGDGRIDTVARPYIIIIGSIPVFALAPIMIIWFGIGLLSKAIMAGFAVFFVSLVQAYEGAHATADRYLGFARSLNASHRRAILKVVIPGSLQWVLTGFRMNVGFALMGAFIAEFVSSEAGLGHYILKASSLYDMPRVFFGLLLISLMAMALTGLAALFQKKQHRE